MALYLQMLTFKASDLIIRKNMAPCLHNTTIYDNFVLVKIKTTRQLLNKKTGMTSTPPVVATSRSPMPSPF